MSGAEGTANPAASGDAMPAAVAATVAAPAAGGTPAVTLAAGGTAQPPVSEFAWTPDGWKSIPVASIGSGTLRAWNTTREWFTYSDNVAQRAPVDDAWANYTPHAEQQMLPPGGIGMMIGAREKIRTKMATSPSGTGGLCIEPSTSGRLIFGLLLQV